MTAEQSLALFMGFILCICLTLNSVILGHDLTTEVKDDRQTGLGIRLITLLVMWGAWFLFIRTYIPWTAADKETVVNAIEQVEESVK